MRSLVINAGKGEQNVVVIVDSEQFTGSEIGTVDFHFDADSGVSASVELKNGDILTGQDLTASISAGQ